MSQRYRDMGEAAWRWVLAQVRQHDGPWLPEAVSEPQPDGAPEAGPGEDRDTLYAGVGGLPLVLAEVERSRALTEIERELAAGIGDRLRAGVPGRVEPSLYLGLAGDMTALRALSPGAEQIALQRLAELSTPAGWASTLEVEPGSSAPVADLVLGTAGVVLAAVWAGGEHAAVALAGGEALLTLAQPTPAGLDWGMLPTSTSRGPNYSHGTAGIAAALAIAGQSLGREDFVHAAQRGAEHLLSLGSLGGGGFVVPHTVPPSTRDVEPVTYTWCHGPTGTSHLFCALAQAGVAEVAGYGVAELRRRCLHSVLTSGVPHRLRPGFWDNDGRCCGTAGVGDVLLDAAQDCADPAQAAELLRWARVMGDALVERAIVDDAGARWRFLEHRQDPPLLPPGTTWMQGAAGIAAFLFRLARVTDHGLLAPVVDRPDQWWAVPAGLRTLHADASPVSPGVA